MRLSSLQSLAAAVALLALPLAVAAQNTTPAEKTAEQVFQNIQVFKGKPANQLRPTMSFIASSLGVRCSFCHAEPFSADTKPTKATARKMIQMVEAINTQSFNGRPQINCYTCHQGHTRPNGNLSIAADEPAPAGVAAPGGPGGPAGPGGPGAGQRPTLPPVQQILDKYVAAVGGASALAAIHSETLTGERVAGGNSTPETLVRADGKLLVTDGERKSGFDGAQYWSANGARAQTDLASDAIGQLQAQLGLYPGANLKAEGARVFNQASVGDATAYVVAVRGANGVARFYFDATSGLLLRMVTSTPTYLGGLPLQVDYADYRAVEGGVKLPFDIKWSTHERTWEQKLTNIAINGTVDAAAFAPPAAAAGGGGR